MTGCAHLPLMSHTVYLLTPMLRSRLPSHSYSLFSSRLTAVCLEVVSESELEVTYKGMSS